MNLRDVRIEFFKSGGPGGQHKNRTLTAVRAIHVPTGLTSVGQESRSQFRNKELALARLSARVTRYFTPRKKRLATRSTRSSQERRLSQKKKHGTKKRMRSLGPALEE
jgi:protein subunit release factor A